MIGKIRLLGILRKKLPIRQKLSGCYKSAVRTLVNGWRWCFRPFEFWLILFWEFWNWVTWRGHAEKLGSKKFRSKKFGSSKNLPLFVSCSSAVLTEHPKTRFTRANRNWLAKVFEHFLSDLPGGQITARVSHDPSRSKTGEYFIFNWKGNCEIGRFGTYYNERWYARRVCKGLKIIRNFYWQKKTNLKKLINNANLWYQKKRKF